MHKVLLLTLLLGGCTHAYVGVGAHPWADSWGEGYDPIIFSARLEQELTDEFSVEYQHSSSILGKDNPGLNLFNVMYKLK